MSSVEASRLDHPPAPLFVSTACSHSLPPPLPPPPSAARDPLRNTSWRSGLYAMQPPQQQHTAAALVLALQRAAQPTWALTWPTPGCMWPRRLAACRQTSRRCARLSWRSCSNNHGWRGPQQQHQQQQLAWLVCRWARCIRYAQDAAAGSLGMPTICVVGECEAEVMKQSG